MVVELVRKHISIASRSCYRSASRHPLLVFVVFVLIWLKRSFPVLFSLLMYASPVIASTLVLLGTLLFYGHENASELQKEGKPNQHEIHNLEIRAMGNTEIGEEAYLVSNMNINDSHNLGNWIDNCQKLKQANNELCNQNPFLVNRYAQLQPSETESYVLKSSDRSRRNLVDPSHNTPGHIHEDNRGWETESDLVGSSSPSASMAEINSMLDELRPLSESEVPFPHVSTDATSDHSLESGEFVDETDDGHLEDIEVKDGEEESLVIWAEDDQRNIMNLGMSELERNQLLDNLIARQKALKNVRMVAEKNMVNISPLPHFNATHISTDRKNHFDLPYHIHENNPGFAHYVMIPRKNPFDLPHDTSGQKPDRAGPTFQSAFQINEPLAPRHKSFDLGPSTLEPSFIPEQIASDPKSSGSRDISDTSECVIQRGRFSEDNVTVKLHQVAQGNDSINELNISGGSTGYEEKNSNESSSSSFYDIIDDIYDGDDDNEEEEYRSVHSPLAHDSKELQIKDSSVDYSAARNTEGGLPQRPSQGQHGLKSWLTGWSA